MALIKYNAKNVYFCGSLKLLPGVNQVEDSALNAVLDHPLFMHRVNTGIIELIKEKKVKGNKRDVKQLIKLMPDVYDVKLLKMHIEENKDENLVKAANKQLSRIEQVEVDEDKDVVITIK